jgi:hypothetical protein
MFQKIVVGVALVAISLSSQLVAQEGKKKQAKRGQQIQSITQLKNSLGKIDLSEEQKKKVEEIIAKHKEGLVAISKKRREIVNAEVNKKMAEARKAGQAEGKKGKELNTAVLAASGLSEEDQQKIAAINQEAQKAAQAMKQEVAKVLTEEQRAKAGLQAKKPAGKKNK